MLKRILKCIIVKIKCKGACKFDLTTDISLQSTFEKSCLISNHTTFHGHLGHGSLIGDHCYLSANIGRFTSIAPHVRCNNGIHPYTEPFVTTSPYFYSTNHGKFTFVKKQIFKELRNYDEKENISIKIGSDCWIGEGVFLVGGIEIGDGAVVLAHAVVTKSVPPYAIVGGVPAKILKYRYDEETIKFLLKIKWWNKPKQWLKEHWYLLSDIQKFKEEFNYSPID